jgi:hypothetical protein
MRAGWLAVMLVVQVCTVAVLFAFNGEDTQAYPMEAGYVVKNQNLDLVYYDGTPAQLTYEKMDTAEKLSKHSDNPVFYKRTKNVRCERKDQDGQQAYRCAVDLRKI